jgi:hypothetical protein
MSPFSKQFVERFLNSSCKRYQCAAAIISRNCIAVAFRRAYSASLPEVNFVLRMYLGTLLLLAWQRNGFIRPIRDLTSLVWAWITADGDRVLLVAEETSVHNPVGFLIIASEPGRRTRRCTRSRICFRASNLQRRQRCSRRYSGGLWRNPFRCSPLLWSVGWVPLVSRRMLLLVRYKIPHMVQP